MTTFMTAYALVWIGMAGYVVRLRQAQARLERLARAMHEGLAESAAWAAEEPAPGRGD